MRVALTRRACFAQRILEHCSREEQASMGLMTDILAAAGQLAKDQYVRPIRCLPASCMRAPRAI